MIQSDVSDIRLPLSCPGGSLPRNNPQDGFDIPARNPHLRVDADLNGPGSLAVGLADQGEDAIAQLVVRQHSS